MKKNYLNERQVADRLTISVYTLQKNRQKGIGIPFFRFERSVRYDEADVIAYEDKNRCTLIKNGGDNVL